MVDLSREDVSNTLRILVATNCHLGYLEKDEICGLDSFKAFDEILSIAEQKEVDFVLLGGNLFHENKPSNSTLAKTNETLRRHCLGAQLVKFQVVSDHTVNFNKAFGHVNIEDPHSRVCLPVFSIHGNHDVPDGVDNLSAVDLISDECNLLNFFGKMDLGDSDVRQITLCPILIRKGSTSIALYGLGNIRDERINSLFQTPDVVQWMRPEAQYGCQITEWFNILVLHFNRENTIAKNSINEHSLPQFLNFIVWGHEHECLADPQEVPRISFHVTQPGSSVATLLVEEETKPKHVLLLEIKGNHYRSTKILFTSVRPFEYTVVLVKDVSDINLSNKNSILDHLDKLRNGYYQDSFEELEMIKEGGFGAVYKCKDGEGKLFAVKKVGFNAITQSRAFNEVKIHSGFNHPNIVQYYDSWAEDKYEGSSDGSDSGSKDHCLYILMELCEKSLDDIIESCPGDGLSSSVGWGYFCQIAEGVAYIHSNDVIHLDLSKGNALMSYDGIIKIADFGQAKNLELAVMGTNEGTLKYRAPEMINGDQLGKYTDVYSLGVLQFELNQPFSATLHERHNMLVNMKRKGISNWGDGILYHLLDLSPSTRPSMEEILAITGEAGEEYFDELKSLIRDLV